MHQRSTREDAIPGTKKQLFIMQNATHANIPVESWEEVVKWLDREFAG
jgi:hypothetical protein